MEATGTRIAGNGFTVRCLERLWDGEGQRELAGSCRQVEGRDGSEEYRLESFFGKVWSVHSG